MNKSKLRIGIIGIRGIPVSYSGFETTAEQISTRLVDAGHIVTVYNRRVYVRNQKSYKGVNLVNIFAPQSKNFESLIHSIVSTFHALLLNQFDVILYLGVGNSLISFLPRLFGIKTVLNIDGLDWQRKKWSILGKYYLLFSEWCSQYLPSVVMTDTSYTQQYYQEKYKKKIPFITNGYIPVKSNPEILVKYNLRKKEYIVWVGRIVPDNNLEEIIIAFKGLSTGKRLVIIGGDHYDKTYQQSIYKLTANDPRIIFTGFIPQNETLAIVKDAYAYVETKRSGGAHPSLIEALGMDTLVIANDHPTTKSIAGSKCFYYSYKKGWRDLAMNLEKLLNKDNKLQSMNSKNAVNHLLTWEQVAIQYENLIFRVERKNHYQ